MGNASRLALALAGAALVAVLFFVFRPGGDEGPAAVTTVVTQPVQTVTEPAVTEPAETEPAETEPAEAEPAPAPEEPTTVAILVRDGRVEGGVRHVQVDQGERVRLVVRADVADHVHLHGYDVMRDVGPGAPAQLVFEADVPGRFEVELEDRRLPIAEIEVRP